MIFKHKLNRESLIIAIEICQVNSFVINESFLKNKYDFVLKHDYDIGRDFFSGYVNINEHLTIKFHSCGISMFVDTYVDNIHMASYTYRKAFLGEWILDLNLLNIKHPMPNSFIDGMNRFSEEVISLYEIHLKEEKREEEIKKKEIYEKEEQILKKYR